MRNSIEGIQVYVDYSFMKQQTDDLIKKKIKILQSGISFQKKEAVS